MPPAKLFPDRTLLLPPRLLPPAAYYAAIMAYGRVVVDNSMRFNKRMKEVHRCSIIGANDPERITVPVGKPVSMTAARWCDIIISPHDAWWNAAWTAIRSAYGRTPFFEFYADDLEPFFRPLAAGMPVTAFNSRLDTAIRTLLECSTPVTYASSPGEIPAGADDYRMRPLDFVGPEPLYYQVRNSRFGFVGGLSVVDMLFNMGPESQLLLHRMIQKP